MGDKNQRVRPSPGPSSLAGTDVAAGAGLKRCCAIQSRTWRWTAPPPLQRTASRCVSLSTCAPAHARARVCTFAAALPPCPLHRARLRDNALRRYTGGPALFRIACLSRMCLPTQQAVCRPTDWLAVTAALRPLPAAPAGTPRPHHHGAPPPRTAINRAAPHQRRVCACCVMCVRVHACLRARKRAARPALRTHAMRANRISPRRSRPPGRPPARPFGSAMPRC